MYASKASVTRGYDNNIRENLTRLYNLRLRELSILAIRSFAPERYKVS